MNDICKVQKGKKIQPRVLYLWEFSKKKENYTTFHTALRTCPIVLLGFTYRAHSRAAAEHEVPGVGPAVLRPVCDRPWSGL